MNLNVYSGLIYNAALLLTLGVIFDAISLRGNRKSLLTEALTGSYLAFVLIAIMVNPWIIERGIMFDTRSILLSLVGMFMGIIPICIAVGGALIFRIFQGGGGVYMGCSVIIASTLMGFIWKNLHHKWKRPFGFWEFYSLGIATHIAMLLLTSLLPAGTRMEVLHTIALPVISIYPIGTLLLGQVMAQRIRRLKEKKALEQSEEQYRELYENAPIPYQALDEEGNLVIVNQAWLDALGYNYQEVNGHSFTEFLHPDYRQHFAINFTNFKATGHIDGVEFILLKKDGSQILVSYTGKILNNAEGRFKHTQCLFTDITEHRKHEAALRSIEWMLTKQNISEESPSSYGDLTELNTCRLILDSVGKDVLQELVSEYLSLMDTSSAVYEKNGDYAVGIFSSSWCQYMDTVSRNLCNTENNGEALSSGKWLCHESCWTDVSLKAIKSGKTIDLECHGGLHLYAVPIRISTGIIGVINFGYGTPPTDAEKLQEIADLYHVDVNELKKRAEQYQTRPAFIIEQAKRKLHSAARIIGEIVERKLAEEELKRSKSDWETIFQSIPHPTYVLDKDQNVIAANANLERAIGLSSAEMKGRKCWELMHGEGTHEPPAGCPFAESCSLDNNATGEMEVETLGGWYVISCKPIYDKMGKIDKVIHIAMDITARKKSEIVLAESEEKYRILTETAQDSIIVHHFDGSVTYANPTAMEFLGVTAATLSSLNIMNHVAPEYHAMIMQHSEERLAGFKGSRLYQIELISNTNQRRQVEVSSTPIISNGNITGIMAVIRDLTDRLADQLALKESQARFAMFMDNFPGAAFIKDKNSRILFVNEHIKKVINGGKRVGKAPLDEFPEDVAQAIIAEDKQALENGVLVAVEENVHSDGSVHYYETTKFALSSTAQEPLLGGIALDVTERIHAEEQRNRYAHRLEILREIDSIVLETLSFDSVCNAAVENLHKLIPFTVLTVNVVKDGYVTIPALLKPDTKYNYLSTEGSYPAKMDYMDVLKQAKTVVINDASKEKLPADMPVRAKLMADGMQSFMYNSMIMQDELVGFLWFCSEQRNFFTEEYREIADEFANQLAIVLHQLRLIDQVKEHNEELEIKVEERTKQLKTANQELETFSYSVAHDLRSPLRTIDGYCNIFMEDHLPQLPEESIALLNTIRSTTHRMDTLIKELLELAKLNRESLKFKQVDMHQLVTRICTTIIEDRFPLIFELEIENIPGCIADESLISQVWQNLLENAVKFTAKCKLRQIQIGSQKRDYDTVYFVRDSGVGFEMQYVDKIFGAFQRLHRENEFEGTGIGLAIVKKVIDRHDGKVWAESTVGKGSIIYFSIPDVIA